MEKFFVDAEGRFLGAFDGPDGGYWDGQHWTHPPEGVLEVFTPPQNAGDTWNGDAWIPDPLAQAERNYAVLIAGGLAIVSTGTPALDGTYSIHADAQRNISAIAAGIAARGRVPGGGADFEYADMEGIFHVFTGSQFLDFAAAVEDFVYAAFRGGGPTQPMTIA